MKNLLFRFNAVAFFKTTMLITVMAFLLGLLGTTCRLQAATLTWTGAYNADWSNGANWNPNQAPVNDDDLVFDTVATAFNIDNINLLNVTSVSFKGMTYNLNISPTKSLGLTGSGVINTSGNVQNFEMYGANSAGIDGGQLHFYNNATAAGAHIINHGGPVLDTVGGLTEFHDNTTAQQAVFFNYGGTNGSTRGGGTDFLDNATAGNAVFTLYRGTATGAAGGYVYFYNNATAGGASFTAYGSATDAYALGGNVQFFDSSTSGSASFTLNSGKSFGYAEFWNNSNAGTSTFILNGASTADGSGGQVGFGHSASAADAQFTVYGASASSDLLNGGRVAFSGSSTAGNATINLHGGSVSGAWGGVAEFMENSSGGNGNVTAEGGEVSGANGAWIMFTSTSNAMNATLTANGGAVAGANGAILSFSEYAKAGNATLTANGGAGGGGSIIFGAYADGGTARAIVNSGATLDISHLLSAGMAIGSIEGSGTFILGGKTLTVGLNNLDTTVSGLITDGTLSGGALIKQGTGTLTLSHQNLFGSSTVNAGILKVTSNGALGVLFGSNAVNDGGTLLLNDVNYGIVQHLALSGTGAGNIGALSNSGTSAYWGDITLNANASISAGGAGNELVLFGGINKNGRTLTISGGGVVEISANGITGSSPNSDLVVDNSTLLLNTANSYNGPTTVQNHGILRLGAHNVLPVSPRTDLTINTHGVFNMAKFSDSIASLAGDNSAIVKNSVILTTSTLSVIGSNNTTFNGVIQGTMGGAQGDICLVKNGSGTLTLTGTNTYGGMTVMQGGGLVGTNSSAFGTGSVYLNGGTLTGDYLDNSIVMNGGVFIGSAANVIINGGSWVPSLGPLPPTGHAPFNTFNQNVDAPNPLLVRVGGLADSEHVFLRYQRIFANGPIHIARINDFDFHLGEQVTLFTATRGVTGAFSKVENDFDTGTIVEAELVYLDNAIILKTVYDSYADPDWLTPNQISVGRMLDSAKDDSRASSLIETINDIPLDGLADAYDLIAPEELSSIFEISFASADIQQSNLENRMLAIRAGATGFSSNLNISGGKETVATDGKAVIAGKEKSVLEPAPDNRWGVFVSGNGNFASLDGNSSAQGYDFTTGGVTVGLDYRLGEHLALGLSLDYAHTWTSLTNGGDMDVDGGKAGLYATWFNGPLYIDGYVGGGYNSYDIKRAALNGNATGSTDSPELDTFLTAGYDFNRGPWTYGLIGSVEYTDVSLKGYTEHGSDAPLDILSLNQYSLKTNLGCRLAYTAKAGNATIVPQVRASWQHEFSHTALPIDARLASGAGDDFRVYGPSIGRESLLVDAGVDVQWNPTIGTFLNYDGKFNGSYQSHNVIGGVRISF